MQVRSSSNLPGVAARCLTPSRAAGAIGLIELRACTPALLDAVLAGWPGASKDVPSGSFAMRSLAGVDQGLLVRVDQTTCWLMPHGGVAIVSGLLQALAQQGVNIEPGARVGARAGAGAGGTSPPRDARTLEDCVLDWLAAAPSPWAIDVLLAQLGQWQAALAHNPRALQEEPPHPHHRVLRRLLLPPMVMVLGRSNIGKSTLTNALAGRGVAIVADEAGTTRDHVGVLLNLAGLVVRWIDTPGLREDPTHEEALARDVALAHARHADLLILAGDPGHPPVALPEVLLPGASSSLLPPPPAPPTLTLCLRDDLPASPATSGIRWDHSISLQGGSSPSLLVLVGAIRDSLLPVPVAHPHALGPWRFWDA